MCSKSTNIGVSGGIFSGLEGVFEYEVVKFIIGHSLIVVISTACYVPRKLPNTRLFRAYVLDAW